MPKTKTQHAALGDTVPPSAGTQKPLGMSVCGMLKWTQPTSLRDAQLARREGTETCAKCREKLQASRFAELDRAALVVARASASEGAKVTVTIEAPGCTPLKSTFTRGES